MSRERIGRTLLVAVLVALVCSTLVTFAVHWLRPLQAAYGALDRNRAIVEAAGLVAPDAEDSAVVSAYLSLDARVLNLETGAWLERGDAYRFDHWLADDAGGSEAGVSPAVTAVVPVYLLRRNDRLLRVVLPVSGPGMWSTIAAYLALERDLNTVAGLVIYRHGETPGIGDRIEDPEWLRTWQGRRVYAADGSVALRMLRDARAENPHQVDLISGASMTSERLAALVVDWLGPAGYGPWLAGHRDQPEALLR